KDQFETAVRTRLQDVQRRLNSVQTSIEQTEEWIKPYVEDIQKITGTWEEEIEITNNLLSHYLPRGHANFIHSEKVIGDMDRSPGQESDRYYDVVVFKPVHFGTGGLENPQAPGQGLVVFYMGFKEFLCCKHVYDEVFRAQKEKKNKQIQNYVQQYIGEAVDIGGDKEELQEKYEDILTEEERERIAAAEEPEELTEIEIAINERLQSRNRRIRNRVKSFFGMTDEFHHDNPKELRRQLLGPYFPTQFYLDYKYDNDLYVMK
ncbi:MAG: hypothetical protein SVW02_01045, partial [Candidatus Nanohaloarchaea archaeon]|nr:hypothetical protein [Candidatus Nanohaloarchaea archaeon]